MRWPVTSVLCVGWHPRGDPSSAPLSLTECALEATQGNNRSPVSNVIFLSDAFGLDERGRWRGQAKQRKMRSEEDIIVLRRRFLRPIDRRDSSLPRRIKLSDLHFSFTLEAAFG